MLGQPLMPANSHLLDEADRAGMDAAFAQAERASPKAASPSGRRCPADLTSSPSANNRRVQSGDPIAHGEMDCLRSAGRMASYRGLTLFTTLTPCMMCNRHHPAIPHSPGHRR